METTPAYERVEQFRVAAYRTLGDRKDSLFELLEAAVVGGPETLVRLSLVEVFRRGWASPSDALNDGDLSAAQIRRRGWAPRPAHLAGLDARPSAVRATARAHAPVILAPEGSLDAQPDPTVTRAHAPSRCRPDVSLCPIAKS
jgi:hypothetical protein